jgi:hypothetical protein
LVKGGGQRACLLPILLLTNNNFIGIDRDLRQSRHLDRPGMLH